VTFPKNKKRARRQPNPFQSRSDPKSRPRAHDEYLRGTFETLGEQPGFHYESLIARTPFLEEQVELLATPAALMPSEKPKAHLGRPTPFARLGQKLEQKHEH